MVLNGVIERLRQHIAGVERIHRGVGIVHHIDVRSVGIEGQASVGASQGCSQAAGVAKAFLVATADRQHRCQGWGNQICPICRIHITIVADHIAAGIAAGRAVERAAGFKGCADVVVCDRGVVGPGDGDGENADVAEAAGAITHGVVEALGQAGTGIECINNRVVVVNNVDVGAVGVDRERAIHARQSRPDRTGRSRPLAGTGADGAYRAIQGRRVASIHVGVVEQHITAGIGACGAVECSAGFQCGAGVIDGNGCIIGAGDDDGQHRCIDQTTGMVEQAVVERVAQCGSGVERIHIEEAVVNHIHIRTVCLERQRAIETLQCCPHHTARAASFPVASAHGRDRPLRRPCEIVAICRVHIAVVADHVAHGIAAWGAIADTSGLNGIADVISGLRRIIGSGDCDRQHTDIGEGTVGDGVVERFAQEGAWIECINRRICIVDDVDVGAIGLKRDRSVEAPQWHTNGACCSRALV